MPQKALIFTKKVLPSSNTFVAVQTKSTPQFQPVYSGFIKTPSAEQLIGDAPTCIQADHVSMPRLQKLLLECFGYLSKDWLHALQACQAKLIHAHFGKGGFYCLAIAKRLNLPLIVTFHGSDITQNDKLSYSKRHREKVFQHADKIIAISKFIQQKLLDAGCPAEKIVQLYTGIDTDFFSPQENKSANPSIMFLGRLIEQKGCNILIEAMHKVTQSVPNVELLIVGDGVERSALEKQAAKMPNIKFVGEQNGQQIKSFLDQAWIMCAPSVVRKRGNEEGLGSVFLEAQAMKTPVVSFNTGGVGEAVINHQTGLLVDEVSSNALAKALIKLINDNALREKFKLAGREHIVKNFNVVSQGQKLSNLYYQTILNQTHL